MDMAIQLSFFHKHDWFCHLALATTLAIKVANLYHESVAIDCVSNTIYIATDSCSHTENAQILHSSNRSIESDPSYPVTCTCVAYKHIAIAICMP